MIMMDDDGLWWWVMMVDDDGWWFVCIHYSFLLQEKCLRVAQLRNKTMGTLQNNFAMVYLNKNEKLNKK